MTTGRNGVLFVLSMYFFIVCFVSKESQYIAHDSLELYRHDPTHIMINLPCKSTNFAVVTTVNTFVSPLHQFDMLNHKDRKNGLKSKCHFQSKSNHSIYSVIFVMALLKCGDVHPDPGPISKGQKRKPKNPCVSCGRGVISSSRAISCDGCERWTHVRCSSNSVSEMMYDRLVTESADFSYVCNSCLLRSMPFNNCDNDTGKAEGSSNGAADSLLADNHFFDQFHKKGLHCIHVNARSLTSKLSELKILAIKAKASIIAVTETWLDDSVNDNEISVPGYAIVRKDHNRNGGGGGFAFTSNQI